MGCGGAEDAPPCGALETALGGVCLTTPTIDASLGGEERNEAGENVAVDLGILPETSCWVTPDEAPAEPSAVRVWGKIDELALGPSKDGMCLAIYDQHALTEHWRTESRCPGIANVAERVECFRTDPCGCDDLEGEAKSACLKDTGPALAYTRTVGRSEGSYEIAAAPTNRPLVFRLSGHPELWKESFMWGVELRTDRLETDESDGSLHARFDPIAVSVADWGVVQALLGLAKEPSPDRGTVAGEIRDCGAPDRSPEPVIGASFSLRPEGQVHGFHNGDPEDLTGFDPALTETRNQGIFGALGVPEGPNRFVAGVNLDDEVVKIADYDLYVPPSAGVIIYVRGRVAWRDGP